MSSTHHKRSGTKRYKRSYSKTRPKDVSRKFLPKQPGKRGYADGMMVLYKPISNSPLPPKFRTMFTCNISGIINSGAFAFSTYSVGLNSCYEPFNVTGATTAFPATMFPAKASLDPTGYTSILNQYAYRQCRVLASRIQVSMGTSATTDTLSVSVAPSIITGQPTSTWISRQQPFAKNAVFTYAQDPRGDLNTQNQIDTYVTVAQVLGVRPEAILDDLSGNYYHAYNNFAGQQMTWTINWNTEAATNLGNEAFFECKVRYWVELFELNVGGMTE
jgi:hypothetical protein